VVTSPQTLSGPYSFLLFHFVMTVPFTNTTFPQSSHWLYLLSSTPCDQLALLPPFLFLHLLSFSFLFLLFVFYVSPICFYLFIHLFIVYLYFFLPLYPFISYIYIYICFSFSLPFLHLVVASPFQAVSPQSSTELLDFSLPSPSLTLHQPYWLASHLLRTSHCPHLSLYKLRTKC
jgi:hypothetical protein